MVKSLWLGLLRPARVALVVAQRNGQAVPTGDVMTATPADLIAAARSYVGSPFHHGGRLPGVGLDCIGVIVCAASACGLLHCDVEAYPLRPNGQLRMSLDAQLVGVPSALAGDVLLMSFSEEPHHVALFTGPTIIHAYITVKRCVEQPMAELWEKRVRGVYRFREFACPAQ